MHQSQSPFAHRAIGPPQGTPKPITNDKSWLKVSKYFRKYVYILEAN